jgi:DNA-binding winged helix-turn-helix (wHTH) protein/tetratricopeptide (TPR) repeat protein
MNPKATTLVAADSAQRDSRATRTSERVPVADGLATAGQIATRQRTPSPESRRSGADVRLFGAFRLDVGEQRLWKGSDELRIRRKPFAILRFLTANPLRLVTQEEVVVEVWGKIAMSESLLRTHMSELRRVLSEGSIETVVGRGYRFLLAVETEKLGLKARAADAVAAHPTGPNLVGRSAESDTLRQTFEAALDQKRQMVFIAGEPGIGKSTLVDAFLAEVAAPDGALIASGSCIEHLGVAEAYLPVLAALGALCRGAGDRRFVQILARHAPTWLAQMPGLIADEELQSLALRIQGASQARMLRELADALDVIAAERPLVLLLEDVHWADHSTIDLLAILGARREPARILVVATYRPQEITKADALARVIAELRGRKQAAALNLQSWSQAAVSDYLAQRFPVARFPGNLARCIQEMTGGNPLFAVAIVDDLENRGTIRPSESGWELAASVADVANRRPDTVRQLIDIQLDRRKTNEQRVLEAASLIGVEFAVGSVAHALELPVDELDTVCEGLTNDKRLLRFVKSEPWPDGSMQSHYAFVHALYRDTALGRVLPTTKRSWHRRIAEGLEAAYGASVETIATQLAAHYDEAQIVAKAVRYYGLGGERAMRRFGRVEALGQFSRVHALMAMLPASDESDRTKLAALKQMGPAIIALQGTQAPELEDTFARTAELARKLSDDWGLLRALLGLQRCHFLRGQLVDIERYEGEVAEVVARLGDPASAAMATVIGSAARLFRGQLAVARRPLSEAVVVLYALESDADGAADAPVVGAWGCHLVTLAWLGGAPDAAVDAAAKMRARAETLRDPFHLCVALTMTALAHVWRRDPEQALGAARRALDVGQDEGSPVWQGRALSIHHWAATVLDPKTAQSHADELQTALAMQLSAGPGGRTAFTPCVAEVYAAAGQRDRALQELDDALAFVERTDERAWSSELHRLRGELLVDSNKAEAERAFNRALEISREQGAKSFELRAALSLAKLDRGAQKNRAALEELRRGYASFTEGFGTSDLVEAKALLDAGR